VKGEEADEVLLLRALGEFKPDMVVNFAAETHVDRSIGLLTSLSPLSIRTVETFSLLEAARRLGFRYVHVSTDEVYVDL